MTTVTDENEEISKDVRELACSIFNCEHFDTARRAVEEAFNNATDEDRARVVTKEQRKTLIEEAEKNIDEEAKKKFDDEAKVEIDENKLAKNCVRVVIQQLVEREAAIRKLNKSSKSMTPNAKTQALEHASKVWHNPEPFSGDPSTAEILIISSNPAYNIDDGRVKPKGNLLPYPTVMGRDNFRTDDDYVARYFVNRYSNESYTAGGPIDEYLDGEEKCISARKRKSTYTLGIGKIIAAATGNKDEVPTLARELKTPSQRGQYLTQKRVLVSEVVHCKGANEVGVSDALKECSKHLAKILEASNTPKLKLVIVCGKPAIGHVFGATASKNTTPEAVKEAFDSAGKDSAILASLKRRGATFGSEAGGELAVFIAPNPAQGRFKSWAPNDEKLAEHLDQFSYLFTTPGS